MRNRDLASTWDYERVRANVARWAVQAIDPAGYVIDDTGFRKDGTASPCVARQYSGTFGKPANCQIAVSVQMLTDTASVAANWRLFCPQAWDPATIGETDRAQAVRDKRARAGIPDEIGHREKRAEGGGLPEQWLIAEWPPDEPERVRYWLSNMDRRTSLKTLVLLAKIRWRVEHDYRELKTGLGIDHFEGRSFTAGTATSPSPCSLKPSSPCYALDPKADTPA